MPSVLFLSLMNGACWGGSEELWYKTAAHALKNNWKVGCAVYHWPEKEMKLNQLKNAGAAIYYLPNKGITKKNFAEKIRFKITKKIELKNYIQSLPVKEYDVVVVNLGEFEIITSAWKNFYKKLHHYVLLFHNYKEENIFKNAQAETLQNWISNAQLNLFASVRIKQVLEKNSGIKITNDEVLINPITFPVPSQYHPYPPLQNGNYCFVMLAALETARKAQDQLIKALSSKKWKDRNWTLHLYGEGKDKKKLQDLIIENDLAKKIFLEGHVADVKTVLQKTHLLLQLTHMDAMPLSVVEAMAMARPVVASKIGDMPLWINEEENGWISKDASAVEIDFTLEKAWLQKELWPQMGKNAFEKFRQKFDGSAEEKLLHQIDAGRNND